MTLREYLNAEFEGWTPERRGFGITDPWRPYIIRIRSIDGLQRVDASTDFIVDETVDKICDQICDEFLDAELGMVDYGRMCYNRFGAESDAYLPAYTFYIGDSMNDTWNTKVIGRILEKDGLM